MKYSLSKNSGSGAERAEERCSGCRCVEAGASDGKQVMCLMQNDRGTI